MARLCCGWLSWGERPEFTVGESPTGTVKCIQNAKCKPKYTKYKPKNTKYKPKYTKCKPKYTKYKPKYTKYKTKYTKYKPKYTKYSPKYTKYKPKNTTQIVLIRSFFYSRIESHAQNLHFQDFSLEDCRHRGFELKNAQKVTIKNLEIKNTGKIFTTSLTDTEVQSTGETFLHPWLVLE